MKAGSDRPGKSTRKSPGVKLTDDAFLYAKQSAAREHVSLGEAVSRLVRAGARSAGAGQRATEPLKGKYSLLPARGEVITSAHVRSIMDELGV